MQRTQRGTLGFLFPRDEGSRDQGAKHSFRHQPDLDRHSALGALRVPWTGAVISELPATHGHLARLPPPLPLQSMAMPTAMHFLKRHSWHWLRVILSMTQQLSYLQE